MKKTLLLSTAILFSTLGVNATNWQPLDVNVQNMDVYLDTDSVKNINSNSYRYVIRYQALGQSEKIAYIIANSRDNKIGIVQSGEYDPDTYRPNAVFDNPHTFMKHVKEDSFLSYTNDIVATIAAEQNFAEDTNEINAVAHKFGDNIPVSYITNINAKDVMTPVALKEYYEKTCKALLTNWKPPFLGYSTHTIINATIGPDGSLLSYKIIESSGNATNDRSVIAALEKTTPYSQYEVENTSIYALNFQFIFQKGMLKKYVLY